MDHLSHACTAERTTEFHIRTYTKKTKSQKKVKEISSFLSHFQTSDSNGSWNCADTKGEFACTADFDNTRNIVYGMTEVSLFMEICSDVKLSGQFQESDCSSASSGSPYTWWVISVHISRNLSPFEKVGQ